MKLLAAGLTDPGLVRSNNEDNVWVDAEMGLMLVADGMGGHATGEVASQLAVDVVREQVANGLQSGRIPALGEVPRHLSQRSHLLAAALHMANEVIHSVARERTAQKGMGTTIVAALLDGKRLSVAHVGDSRIYLFKAGKLTRLTRDHSLVEEQVAAGIMTEEQAEQSEMKNVLTRALGTNPQVKVDVNEFAVAAGDLILLCSDGLSRMADDEVIEYTLGKTAQPLEICRELIKLAIERGGKDNVTVAAGRVSPSTMLEKIASAFATSRQ